MQYSIATLVTLFAAALSAPSDVSPRQATLATLVTYTDAGCQPGNVSGSVALINTTICTRLPAGIAGGKIAQNLPSGCTIKFYSNGGCGSAPVYTYPTDNTRDPHACFTLGGLGQPIAFYQAQGTCGA